MLMFSYDEKLESKQMEIKQELPEESKQRKTWALPHFFWLLLLPLFEVTWQVFTLEVVGTALGPLRPLRLGVFERAHWAHWAPGDVVCCTRMLG